ncbi:hypothetical protein HBI56_201750 [Parastagonospora nodorum]|uniref:Uncharacterized protein n=2 Tax=Phaeosphaeria nodorum (strain SN15 / ATCC MYA-4574 / FGSC 10173) TaxID=321614 RepID=A0A7U2EVS3_PHANO|nr:hypothetical protein SNOG_15580 [Parastagonospora nodorum SN15]KAH3905649.1 hypothetical protein HBH56_216280 [Parastagonospora nodorum]EAT76955.1 hypothetical protein SNOG_15580 [Parastagonospora nodorum SN15]KAH3922687.1 hypothetical protein HBH54_221240 [Parastagonospora nodorum]KAH3942057.1 hypothetical protein HBH53_191150 [Parastagonospora nodorum]KAH3961307.1 hypothetical protein HBH51_184960 [Parastagonospora nodorum]
MKFFAAIAAFAAVAAAQYSAAPVESSCSAVVTVTVTEVKPHLPSAPATHAATGPAPYPTVPAVPSVPVGTGVPSSPVLGGSKPSGTASPSGTGSVSAPPSQFTGAASNLKVGGAMAAGAIVALFL